MWNAQQMRGPVRFRARALRCSLFSPGAAVGFFDGLIKTAATAVNQVAQGNIGGALHTSYTGANDAARHATVAAYQTVGLTPPPPVNFSSGPGTIFQKAVGALGSGDDYRSIANIIQRPLNEIAKVGASLPVPLANLFNLAPAVTAGLNDLVANGIDAARGAVGAVGSNQAVRSVTDKLGGGTAPAPAVAVVGRRMMPPPVAMLQSSTSAGWPGLVPWLRSKISQVFA